MKLGEFLQRRSGEPALEIVDEVAAAIQEHLASSPVVEQDLGPIGSWSAKQILELHREGRLAAAIKEARQRRRR